MNERFWELLGKYWSDQISPGEKAELEQMLLDHPDHWLKMGMMEQLEWETGPRMAEKRLDQVVEKVIQSGERSRHRRVRRRRRLWQGTTAILLVLLAAGLMVWLQERKKTADGLTWQQAVTTNGMKTMLRLADGTQLWLNAGSSLRYPENFDDKKREVYLSGEAYFKVMHDAARPFVIHTDNMKVTVLGTEVDVRAYQEEKFAAATLINGAVAVTVHRENETKTVVLKPKEKIEVRQNAVVIDKLNSGRRDVVPSGSLSADIAVVPVTMKDSLISEVAWKQNTLLFENETMQSLARRLERWYGVTIDIKDSVIAQERFTGRADNISVEKLLRILQLLKPFHYTMHDKNIIIKK